jgi:hypothetical protein
VIALPLLLEAMAAYEAELENGATVGVEKARARVGFTSPCGRSRTAAVVRRS